MTLWFCLQRGSHTDKWQISIRIQWSWHSISDTMKNPFYFSSEQNNKRLLCMWRFFRNIHFYWFACWLLAVHLILELEKKKYINKRSFQIWKEFWGKKSHIQYRNILLHFSLLVLHRIILAEYLTARIIRISSTNSMFHPGMTHFSMIHSWMKSTVHQRNNHWERAVTVPIMQSGHLSSSDF